MSKKYEIHIFNETDTEYEMLESVTISFGRKKCKARNNPNL